MVQEAQPLPESIKEAMERTPQAFQPERAQGVNATIQYNFTGAEPGSWVVKVADGKCEVNEGTADSPTVTINSPSDVWLKILRRELDGATAFMSGQFTFTGDMGVLMQMPTWFGQQ
ncbi:MAG: SCP2 sterol-binding domain-containing protein [Chloroflexi bacterium]|nr:SCP2 sterol-binding domain-containing protein [Chloroflexota bacterium]